MTNSIRKERAQAELFDRGLIEMPRPAAARKVPYGDALRHIIRTVKRVMKEEGQPLGDGPFQDLVSTIYIHAARVQGVSYDFTTEEK